MQGFPLLRRKVQQPTSKLRKAHCHLLRSVHDLRHELGEICLPPARCAAGTVMVNERVMKRGHQPSATRFRPRGGTGGVAVGFEQRFLHEILRIMDIPCQNLRITAKAGKELQQAFYLGIHKLLT